MIGLVATEIFSDLFQKCLTKISHSDFEDKGIQIIANIIMENIFILN